MSNLANFVWSIADQLRGVYKPHQYGDVILPFTILRRLDCIMEPHRATMRELAEKYDNPVRLGIEIKKATVSTQHPTGLGFYNTSPYSFATLLAEPDSLRANLQNYLERFSSQIDVFERFKFAGQIATLDEKDRLYLVVSQFADLDLHPDVVPNAEMGDLFEHLIRKFAEASNEDAGEHYTPRDAIRLMVDLLFAEKDADLTEPGIVRTVYDPTAGTGGMLSVAEEHLLAQNPEAKLVLFGQELNDQSYAICKSDMIAKGQDPSNIRLGDTLADDQFADRKFDYCLANPPYGFDWKASEKAVKAERQATGARGRFAAGLPKIGDGQMLFLSHLAHKLRPAHEGGGRAGVVLNGSPLFNGAAESGESEIRRHLLENDLVEAIIALPTNMFFNTGISTYIWLLDNAKQPERQGGVQLIDASSFFTKMRKNLGDKSREISDADRERIVRIYDAFEHQSSENADHSRVFATTDFGYWTITVERPLRLAFEVTDERRDALLAACAAPKGLLAGMDAALLRSALDSLGNERWTDRDVFVPALRTHLKDAGLRFSAPALKALLAGLSERDDDAAICHDAKGNPEPDVSLRDTENIPFGWCPPGADSQAGGLGDSAWGRDNRAEVIVAYVEHEVLPHVPDAWIDHAKTKTGYEIPFSRHFYRYAPPRQLEEIDADLDVLVKEIIDLLREVEA